MRVDIGCQARAEGWGQMVFRPRCVGLGPITQGSHRTRPSLGVRVGDSPGSTQKGWGSGQVQPWARITCRVCAVAGTPCCAVSASWGSLGSSDPCCLAEVSLSIWSCLLGRHRLFSSRRSLCPTPPTPGQWVFSGHRGNARRG